jgi:adenosine kinase
MSADNKHDFQNMFNAVLLRLDGVERARQVLKTSHPQILGLYNNRICSTCFHEGILTLALLEQPVTISFVKKSHTQLVITGSISIDRIMNFGGKYKDLIQPDKLHVLSVSILIDKLANTRGGTGANIAYSLALLGEKPALLGSVGPDAEGYMRGLSESGVDTSRIHTSTLPTPTFTVLTDSDDNQVGGFYPGAMSDITGLNLKPWHETNSLVVIAASDPLGMDQLVSECLANDLPYAYDVGQQVTNISAEQLKHGLSGAKLLFANDYELGTILSRTGYSTQELEVMIPLIITTLGKEGTKISGSQLKEPLRVAAVVGVQVVDPTGAGDSYRAGFLYGYVRKCDLGDCARLGSVVASYAIEQNGTQEHHFTLAEVAEKYYSAYGVHLPK